MTKGYRECGGVHQRGHRKVVAGSGAGKQRDVRNTGRKLRRRTVMDLKKRRGDLGKVLIRTRFGSKILLQFKS